MKNIIAIVVMGLAASSLSLAQGVGRAENLVVKDAKLNQGIVLQAQADMEVMRAGRAFQKGKHMARKGDRCRICDRRMDARHDRKRCDHRRDKRIHRR